MEEQQRKPKKHHEHRHKLYKHKEDKPMRQERHQKRLKAVRDSLGKEGQRVFDLLTERIEQSRKDWEVRMATYANFCSQVKSVDNTEREVIKGHMSGFRSSYKNARAEYMRLHKERHDKFVHPWLVSQN